MADYLDELAMEEDILKHEGWSLCEDEEACEKYEDDTGDYFYAIRFPQFEIHNLFGVVWKQDDLIHTLQNIPLKPTHMLNSKQLDALRAFRFWFVAFSLDNGDDLPDDAYDFPFQLYEKLRWFPYIR